MSNIQIIDKSLIGKVGVKNLATQILNSLENGEINPIELKGAFKAIEDASKEVKAKLDEYAIKEAEKYGEKNFNVGNINVQYTESLGPSYDYSNCGHLEYLDVLEKLEPLLKRKKEIEEELKAMKKSREEVNIETGEVYTVYPPIKKSTTGVKITLK